MLPLTVPPVLPVYVSVYALIVNCAVRLIFPVTTSDLVAHVEPSLHPLNVYPVFATAVTAVPVVLYANTCTPLPLTVPPVLPVYVSVYALIVNCAVRLIFPVTTSDLVAHVEPSLHPLNVYPVFATAVTAVPVVLYANTCTPLPLTVPPVLGVTLYVSV